MAPIQFQARDKRQTSGVLFKDTARTQKLPRHKCAQEVRRILVRTKMGANIAGNPKLGHLLPSNIRVRFDVPKDFTQKHVRDLCIMVKHLADQQQIQVAMPSSTLGITAIRAEHCKAQLVLRTPFAARFLLALVDAESQNCLG